MLLYIGIALITFIVYIRLKLWQTVNNWPFVSENYNPFLGHLSHFVKRLSTPSGFIDELIVLAKKYPKSCCLYFHPFRPIIVLHDKAAIKALLVTDSNKVRNDHGVPTGLGVPRGLLGLNGQEWKMHRKLLEPAFKQSMLMSYVPIINECSRDFIEVLLKKQHKANKNRPAGPGQREPVYFDMVDLLHTFPIDAMLKCLLSYNCTPDVMNDPNAKGLVEWTEVAAACAHYLLYVPHGRLTFPFHPLKRKQSKIMLNMNVFLDRIIDSHRKQFRDEGKLKDFIDIMILANEKSVNFPKQDMRDELMTVLLAGQETSFCAISWFFYHLAKHPTWAAKAKSEVDEILQGATDVTWEHIQKLDIVDRMIKESQRLIAIAPTLNSRTILDDDIIIGDGRVIRKGSEVLVNLSGYHRNEAEFSKDADVYDPDRWLEKNQQALGKRLTLMPFGFGQRTCIGKNFATLEIKIFITKVISTLKMRLKPGDEPILKHSITSSVLGGFMVNVEELE